MIQIICGIILVLIGIFVFWKFPIKSDTKSLTLAALFIVLAAILKRLSIMIPLFGFESLKISIEVIPMLLAGIMLAPGLQCLIPSIVVATIKENYMNYLEKAIQVILIFLGIGACFYVFSLDQVVISKNVVDITLNFKIIISVVCIVMISVLFTVMRYYKKKLNDQEYHLFNLWLISVVLVEMVITFMLTPYWLQVMYGIPFTLSLFIRVIKECIMIPVDIILGYSVLRVLKRL